MFSFRKCFMPAAVGTSLLLAACGSSSSSPAASGGASSSQAAAAPSAGTTIATARGPAGTYLVGASSRALYLWAADSSGKSSCSGACASTWPPLTAGSLPKTQGAAIAADLSLIKRSGGVSQVAYKGHPLYYYAPDTGSGMTTGEGSNSFGAKWWLVAPSGVGIVKTASSTGGSASGSSTSSAGGSGRGGWG